MKKVVLFGLVAIAAFAAYWFLIRKTDGGFSGEKQEAIATKKHSSKFNASITNMMTAYFGMQTAFIEADTTKAKQSCKQFIALVDSVDFKELKDDSAAIIQNAKMMFSDVKANAVSLLTQSDIIEMRKDFSMVSENLYPAFKSINYSGTTMYWQNCPMAFGEDKPANWISSTKEIMNPYMGKNHPEYKATMLHCGEVKDILIGK
jgi:Protein of unknown function (DUF3347)